MDRYPTKSWEQQPDGAAGARSNVPNHIHRLDAEVSCLVMLKMMKKGMGLNANHAFTFSKRSPNCLF